MDYNYLELDLEIKDDLENDLFQIYKAIRPNVSKEDFIFEEINSGLESFSHKAYSKNDPKNSVVFKSFDVKEIENFFDNINNISDISNDENFGENLFDKNKEILIIDELSKYDLCKPVYAAYLNGVCFGYAHGVTCTGSLMLSNDYLNEFAFKLAKFHSIKIDFPNCEYDPHFGLTKKFSELSQSSLTDTFQSEIDKIKEYPFNKFPKFSDLEGIAKDLNFKLEKIGFGELGLCHNDLNQKNIIWNSEENKLSFIEFEKTMTNYIAHDIGIFYTTFTGYFIDDVDESLFPNDNYRLKFVHKYLEEKYKIKNEKIEEEVFKEEVKKLNIRSNLFALYFMLIKLTLSLDYAFKPETFLKTELIGNKFDNSIKCGLYGYKLYKLTQKVKSDLLSAYDQYYDFDSKKIE